MIELISSIFNEGDYIKIFFNNSSKSVEGYIFKILSSSIAIKTIDGKLCGVKGNDIDSFEEGFISNTIINSPQNIKEEASTQKILSNDNISSSGINKDENIEECTKGELSPNTIIPNDEVEEGINPVKSEVHIDGEKKTEEQLVVNTDYLTINDKVIEDLIDHCINTVSEEENEEIITSNNLITDNVNILPDNSIQTNLLSIPSTENVKNNDDILEDCNLKSELLESSDYSVALENENNENLIIEENGCSIKVVGKLPLEELESLTKKDNKRKAKLLNGQQFKKSYSSFSELEQMDFVVETDGEENQSFVHGLGKIVCGKTNFGFIEDIKTSEQLYFSYFELIDIDYMSKDFINQLVVYSRSTNDKGLVAKTIHKPNTIENLLSLSDRLFQAYKKSKAIQVVEHILGEYPDSFCATKKMDKFSPRRLFPRTINKDALYAEAKRQFEEVKDINKSIELYTKVIESGGYKTESAIKDLAQIYVSRAKKSSDDEYESYVIEAKQFVEKYKKYLPDNLSTWSLLENFYYSLRDFDSFKKVSSRLLQSTEFKRRKQGYVSLLNKYASVLLFENNIDEAKKILNISLSVLPNWGETQKLIEVSEAPDENKAELDSIISAGQKKDFFDRLTPYTYYILEQYDEYEGLNEKKKNPQNQTHKDLEEIKYKIKQYSEKRNAGNPRERAKVLLTQGKLIQRFEPDDTFALKSTMAKYCNDMAKIYIYNGSSTDVIRFFYNESFELEENWLATRRQVAYYLLTCIYDGSNLKSEIENNLDITVKDTFEKIFTNDVDNKIWNNIVNITLYNNDIMNKIIDIILDNDDYYKEACKALKNYGFELSYNSTKEDFVEVWNKLREQNLSTYKNLIAKFQPLYEINHIDEMPIKLEENLSGMLDYTKNELDKERIRSIITNIVPCLKSYCQAKEFKFRERNYQILDKLANGLKKEIYESPTKLSFEAILPLINNIKEILSTAFENFVEQSKPDPIISLLSNRTVVDEQKVLLQIELSLDKSNSTIYEVSIEIEKDDNVILIDPGVNNPFEGCIEGGDKQIFLPIVKISDKALNEQSVALTLICKFTSGAEKMSTRTQVSLHLYNPEDFTLIPNPFAKVAEGGPLDADSNMFFGRKKEINNVIEAINGSESKQVIIYGQKRCGKSSVLNRIHQALTDQGVFCISISIGSIIRNLTEAAFYYKILREISTQLVLLDDAGEEIPNFSVPDKNSFINEDPDNPADTFITYIIKFKRECQRTPGWVDRKLVILVDEFTYIYGAIKENLISKSIMQQWKAVTQDGRARFSAVFVGQDVIPAFKNEPFARNAFGVFMDQPLTYLEDEDAEELIINPVKLNGESRYKGTAVATIKDYTACSPYYLQIFCSHLIQYMNEKHYIYATEADVANVARLLTEGAHSLDESKFENLLSARESDEPDNQEANDLDDALKVYKDDDVKIVLKAVAKASEYKVYANSQDIATGIDPVIQNGILKQLTDRKVLDKKEDNYKIKVRLYKEWLINH